MLVTDIRRIDDKRFCLYTDYEPFGPVYQSDINRLKLDIGSSIEKSVLDVFRNDCLYKRAMNKAISSIKYSEKCEHDIREKLEGLYFDDDIIDFTVERLKEFGYIDDERYTSVYIRSHINKKSRKAITYTLLNKHIPQEIIDRAFEDNEFPGEEAVLSELILKKYEAGDLITKKEKIISSMLRKGYSYSLVQSCINKIIADGT